MLLNPLRALFVRISRVPDLAETEIIGVDLGSANLKGARFVGARLVAANVVGANLSGADLRGAELQGAAGRRHNDGDALLHHLSGSITLE